MKKIDLASPKWQGVGVLICLVGVVVSTGLWVVDFVSRHGGGVLSITERQAFNTSINVSSDMHISYLVNGEAIPNVVVIDCDITNAGGSPIAVSDFNEPLTISCTAPYKLTAALDISVDEGIVHSTWTSGSSNSYILKPLLLNPGDKTTVSLFISSTNAEQIKTFNPLENLSWKARIVGVKNIQTSQTIVPTTGAFFFMAWLNAFVVIFLGGESMRFSAGLCYYFPPLSSYLSSVLHVSNPTHCCLRCGSFYYSFSLLARPKSFSSP